MGWGVVLRPSPIIISYMIIRLLPFVSPLALLPMPGFEVFKRRRGLASSWPALRPAASRVERETSSAQQPTASTPPAHRRGRACLDAN